MSYSTNKLLQTAGQIAPQYYNAVGDVYEVQQGANGAIYVIVRGTSAVTDNPVAVTQAPKSSFQTMKTFTGTVNTSSTTTTVQTLYTVTAGKTFYLTDFVVCNNTSNFVQVSINASATAGASPIFIGHAISTAPLDALNIGTEPSVAGGTPVTFQVTPGSASATITTFFISGYEQ